MTDSDESVRFPIALHLIPSKMPVVHVGDRPIEYRIRHSKRAKLKRVEVRLDGVLVVVPQGTPPHETRSFVDSKRQWLRKNATGLVEAPYVLDASPSHSGTRSSVLFRDNRFPLRIQHRCDAEAKVGYRGGVFRVTIPRGMTVESERATITEALDRWVDDRLLRDADRIIRRRGEPFNLRPTDIRIGSQKTLWGSCARNGVIRLNRALSRVPYHVYEYVVVHELCHLRHLNHSRRFWRLVEEVLPGYERRREWLDLHGLGIG